MHSYSNRVYMHDYCSKCVNIHNFKRTDMGSLWLKYVKFLSFSIMQEYIRADADTLKLVVL